MSKENIQLFFEQVEKNEQLQERIKKVQTDNQDGVQASIVKLGKEAGYDFSKEDLQQVSEEIVTSMQGDKELDDSELETVSGGIGVVATTLIVGGVTATVVAANVVGFIGAGIAYHNIHNQSKSN